MVGGSVKASLKDSLREIKNSLPRFISILLIVFLGVFVLTGLISTGQIMRNTIENKINLLNQEDIKITCPIGFEKKDIEIIESDEDISEIEYGFDKDLFLKGDSTVVKILNMPYEISKPEIVEGRNINSPEEIVLDEQMKKAGYKINDVISFKADDDDDDDNNLARLNYKVVGFAQSIDYLDKTAMNYSERGYGKISHFAYIDDSNFMGDPTIAKIKYLGTENLATSDDEYVDYMNKKTRALKIDMKNRPKERLLKIQNDILTEIDDAEVKISDAEDKLTDAKDKLTRGRDELNKGKSQYREGLNKYNREEKKARDEIASSRDKLYKASVEIDDGERELISGYEKLRDGKKKIEDSKKEIADGRSKLQDGKNKYSKGLGQVESSEKALSEGETKLLDGRKKLDDGWVTIEESKKKLEEGLRKYNDGRREYLSGLEELESGKNRLVSEMNASSYEDAKSKIYTASEIISTAEEVINKFGTIEGEINKTNSEIAGLNSKVSEIDMSISSLNNSLNNPEITDEEKSRIQGEIAGLNSQKDELNKNINGLNQKLEILTQSKAEINKAIDEISKEVPGFNGDISSLKSKINEGKAAITKIDEGEKKLAAAKATLDSSKTQLDEGQKQLEEGIREAEKGEREYKKSKGEIEENKKKLQDARLELEKAKREIDSSEKKLKDGEEELKKGEKEYDENYNKYLDGRSELDAAKEKYKSGQGELQRGEERADKELGNAKSELDSARNKLYKSEKDLNKGQSEFDENSEKADREISDAKEKIKDGRKYLSLIKQPRYSITPRHQSGGVNTYIDYSKRVDGLSLIFPIFFFAIALLVSFTTMTRMVDDNRTIIGTYKALGYTNKEIARKFLIYGSLASLIGGVLGAFGGSYIITSIIANAYSTKTIFENNILITLFPLRMVFAIIVGFIFTTVSALMTLNKNLRENTASLLRAKPPVKGNRILLEKIPFIWNNMSFLSKVTARNLFLSKKRMFMTVIGVMGCAALLVLGYGIAESVEKIEPRQFEKILNYDISVLYEKELFEDEYEDYRKAINSKNYDYTETYQELFTVDYEEMDQDVNVIVPSDNEEFKEFNRIYDAKTKEEIEIPKRGAIITEKLSKLKDLKPGDAIEIRDVYGNEFEVEIAAICEYYMGHNIYMGKDYFEKLTGSDLILNTDLIKSNDKEDLDEFSNKIIENKSVMNASNLDDLKGVINQFLYSITKVELIILIMTAILEIVVLYNLTNINIEERIREISSIKVLGFYPRETTSYIYKETYILAIFGIILGLFVGKLLHFGVLQIVVPFMAMLPEDLSMRPFIFAAIITALINTVIMIIFHFRIKKINPLDALKSNE